MRIQLLSVPVWCSFQRLICILLLLRMHACCRHMKGEDDDVWDEVFLDDEKENYSALASELKLPGWQARPSLASSMVRLLVCAAPVMHVLKRCTCL